MRYHRRLFINIFSLILFVISVTFFSSHQIITLAATTSGCGKYWGGNWTITSGSYCGVVDETIPVSKHLVLEPNSVLELNGTTNLIFGFKYRRAITINNPGSSLTDYQILVTVDTASLISAGKMNSDCSDIEFGDSDLNGYPYWIESGCNSANTRIWVRVTNIPAGTKTIYMYYGNPSAVSMSNGEATFEFFDDFEGTSLDTSKWSVSSSNYSVSNSILRINNGGIRTADPIISLDNGYVLEAKVIYYGISPTYSGTVSGVSNGYTAGGNSEADATVLYMRGSNSRDVYRWVGSGATTSYDCGAGVFVFTSSDNTWYVLSEKFNSSGVVLGKDRSTETWVSCNWARHINYITLGYFTGSTSADAQDTGYDWVFVRKYSPTEPTVSVSSTEETNLPQYIYVYSGAKIYIYPPAGINKPS